ncbi:MAG TPA: hypothetical protein VK850_19820 [Candidatus Binatia bacterium]|nr:hypothetical protein [Candidatus Binatia bacterium]
MLKWFKSLFKGPEPAGPPQTLRAFHTNDAPISKEGILVDQDGWLIDSRENHTVSLFEVPTGDEQCMLTFKAKMRTSDLQGRAFLELWCRVPGVGEFFSKGLNKAVRATTDWASYEIPFFLKKGQKADLVKLNLVVEGIGKTWIKDVELLKTPLKA